MRSLTVFLNAILRKSTHVTFLYTTFSDKDLTSNYLNSFHVRSAPMLRRRTTEVWLRLICCETKVFRCCFSHCPKNTELNQLNQEQFNQWMELTCVLAMVVESILRRLGMQTVDFRKKMSILSIKYSSPFVRLST